MYHDVAAWRTWILKEREAHGLGVCCDEAQADGVPCPTLDRDCNHCTRAHQRFLLRHRETHGSYGRVSEG